MSDSKNPRETFVSLHERGAIQGTARVRPVRTGFVCPHCGHASMDSGICPVSGIPLEELAHSRPEDDALPVHHQP